MQRVGYVILVAVSLFLVGCEAGGPMATLVKPKVYPPDYDTPESAFTPANFDVLASEFIDEYAGKYVVFEASYKYQLAEHGSAGVLVDIEGQRVLATNLRSMTLGSPEEAERLRAASTSGDAHMKIGKVNVLWHESDRELARPLVGLPFGSKVKVFAYVLPAGQEAQPKSRNDVVTKPFSKPYLWLVRVVPVGTP